MSDPFLGEIKMVAFNFAPRFWADCDGQILPISQNQALFALLGTIYGGDGRTTFALPNLKGRVPIHVGQGSGLTARSQGAGGGQESVTLSTAQMPIHNHTATGDVPSTDVVGNQTVPGGHRPARANDGESNYSDAAATGNMAADVSIGNAGGNQAHDNMPPFLTIRFVIALSGIFPSRN